MDFSSHSRLWKIFSLLTFVAVSVITQSNNDLPAVCKKPRLFGVCYMLYSAWYYDHITQQCVEFVYGGCGGNANRFPTEEECYQTCREKLIQLHAPRDVSVAHQTMTEIYIYWLPPLNFKLHDPENITETTPANQSTTLVSGDITVGNVKGSDSNTTSNTSQSGNSSDQQIVTTTQQTVIGAKLANYVGKDRVPFHMANLTHYVVSYKVHNEDDPNGPWITAIVKGMLADYKMTNLTAGTHYDISVSAVYITNTTKSTTIRASTQRPDSKALNCYCDQHGTIGGLKTCNMTLHSFSRCPCKEGYSGLFCEICSSQYYRTGISLPCHQCPCTNVSSSKSCHFVEGYLHCTTCKEGYAGNLCHRCGNGYYRDPDQMKAVCIKCKGCSVYPGPICDPYTGQCLNCNYNRMGHSCSECMPGYVGDPVKNISCILKSEAAHLNPTGVIVSVCLGTVILLSGVIAFIIYRKVKTSQTRRPFWTVELKEDHEGVDFSSVPEDEYHEDRNVEDLDFYGRRYNEKKAQPYAKLEEDI